MEDLNRVHVRGRLTRDPELRRTKRGTGVLNVSLGTTILGGNGQAVSSFHDLTVWDDRGAPWALYLADAMEKGSSLEVYGHLTSESYDKDGQKRYVKRITVTDVVSVNGSTREDCDAACRAYQGSAAVVSLPEQAVSSRGRAAAGA